MEDWQMREYNELRLQVIVMEYNKYLKNRIHNILEQLYVDNIYNICPWRSGYIKDIGWWEVKNKYVIGEADVSFYGDECEEYKFPASWLTLSDNELQRAILLYLAEIDNKQKAEKKRMEETKKLLEIESLEKRIEMLKGSGDN